MSDLSLPSIIFGGEKSIYFHFVAMATPTGETKFLSHIIIDHKAKIL